MNAVTGQQSQSMFELAPKNIGCAADCLGELGVTTRASIRAPRESFGTFADQQGGDLQGTLSLEAVSSTMPRVRAPQQKFGSFRQDSQLQGASSFEDGLQSAELQRLYQSAPLARVAHKVHASRRPVPAAPDPALVEAAERRTRKIAFGPQQVREFVASPRGSPVSKRANPSAQQLPAASHALQTTASLEDPCVSRCASNMSTGARSFNDLVDDHGDEALYSLASTDSISDVCVSRSRSNAHQGAGTLNDILSAGEWGPGGGVFGGGGDDLDGSVSRHRFNMHQSAGTFDDLIVDDSKASDADAEDTKDGLLSQREADLFCCPCTGAALDLGGPLRQARSLRTGTTGGHGGTLARAHEAAHRGRATGHRLTSENGGDVSRRATNREFGAGEIDELLDSDGESLMDEGGSAGQRMTNEDDVDSLFSDLSRGASITFHGGDGSATAEDVAPDDLDGLEAPVSPRWQAPSPDHFFYECTSEDLKLMDTPAVLDLAPGGAQHEMSGMANPTSAQVAAVWHHPQPEETEAAGELDVLEDMECSRHFTASMAGPGLHSDAPYDQEQGQQVLGDSYQSAGDYLLDISSADQGLETTEQTALDNDELEDCNRHFTQTISKDSLQYARTDSMRTGAKQNKFAVQHYMTDVPAPNAAASGGALASSLSMDEVKTVLELLKMESFGRDVDCVRHFSQICDIADLQDLVDGAAPAAPSVRALDREESSAMRHLSTRSGPVSRPARFLSMDSDTGTSPVSAAAMQAGAFQATPAQGPAPVRTLGKSISKIRTPQVSFRVRTNSEPEAESMLSQTLSCKTPRAALAVIGAPEDSGPAMPQAVAVASPALNRSLSCNAPKRAYMEMRPQGAQGLPSKAARAPSSGPPIPMPNSMEHTLGSGDLLGAYWADDPEQKVFSE